MGSNKKSIIKEADTTDLILEGLEIAYKKMVEYKRYKKTPIIVAKGNDIVALNPNDIDISKNVYKK